MSSLKFVYKLWLVTSSLISDSPQEPELVVQTEKGQYEYSEGFLLRATCTIRDGRPVSNMSWYLGKKTITFLYIIVTCLKH